MAKVTGIGGVFFKSCDPATLREWYRSQMGVALQSWGGAQVFDRREDANNGKFGYLMDPEGQPSGALGAKCR